MNLLSQDSESEKGKFYYVPREGNEEHVDGFGPSYPIPRFCSRMVKGGRGIRTVDPLRGYDVYLVHFAYKIYNTALENTSCKKIGDGFFFDAKKNLLLLLKDYPICRKDERLLLPHAFDKYGLRACEDVASTYPDCTASQLWDRLEAIRPIVQPYRISSFP